MGDTANQFSHRAQPSDVSEHLAVLSAFLILSGALADKYGRRRIFIIGLAGFGVTSVLASVAVAARVSSRARAPLNSEPARGAGAAPAR